MNDALFDWDDANIAHIAEHDVTPEEAEDVVLNDPLDAGFEVVDGEERWSYIGETREKRLLRVAITLREEQVRVVTAYEPDKGNKTVDTHVGFSENFMTHPLPLIGDTDFPSLFLVEDEMANENQRFQSLENGAKELTGRVNAAESGLAGVNRTLGKLSAQIANLSLPERKWTRMAAISAILSLPVTLAGVLVNYSASKETRTSMETRVDAIDKQVVQLRTIIRMLASEEIGKVLDEVVSASRSGNAGVARDKLASLDAKVSQFREARIPADQEFFTKTVSSFQTIAQTNTVERSSLNSALEKLASYRSAVIFPGNRTAVFASGSSEPLTPDDVPKIPRDHDGYFKGFHVYLSNAGFTEPSGKVGVNVEGEGSTILMNTTKGDLFHILEKPQDAKLSVSGVLIISPSQTLDGFQWKNVIFMNVHIVYRGGSAKLDHVAFVNCTFEVVPQEAEQLLDYALLGQDKLQLGGL